MKIAVINLAFEVPDDFNWGGDPDIMDQMIDLVCKIDHKKDPETVCNMVSGSGRVMTVEQFEAELDSE